MKIKHSILSIYALLVLLFSAVSPSFQADQPFEWVSDITPGSGKGTPPPGHSGEDGPWNHRVMSASSGDGLTWVKDDRIIADQASVPDAIVDKEGNIRVYYVDWYNGHVISVALSRDGINWIYKKVTIEGEVEGSQTHVSPVDPDIVLLPDGSYRLYYMYAGKIYSAISNYGIYFTKENGVRYQQDGMVYDPDVVKMGDVWRMFASLGPKNLATVSSDGLNFSWENELPFDGSVSSTIPVENGYRMYYMWQGNIFSAFSSDGRNWVFEGLRLDNAGDPTVIRLQDGTYKMFYKTWIEQVPQEPPRVAGVNVGDWWKYGNITLEFNSSDPTSTPPMFQPFFVANETDWQIFNVTEVSGRNVTLQTIVHFKNQTEISETIQCDIANGTSVNFMVIAPNLKVGEPISVDGPPILHEKSYISIGVPRDVVVFNSSEQLNDAPFSGSVTFNLMWDKFTGILLGIEEHLNITNGSAYYKADFQMNVVETNLWGLQGHIINVNGQQFMVTTFSNASISNMALNIEEKALIFNTRGFGGTICCCNITIPKTLVSCNSNGEWQLYIDESPIADFLVVDNDTYTLIYFTHALSSHQVKIVGQQVIPEFPSWYILTLLIITIFIAAAFKKVKHAQKFSASCLSNISNSKNNEGKS